MAKSFLPTVFCLLPYLFAVASDAQVCRSRGVYLEANEFMAETCALCYIYIPLAKFKTFRDKWNITRVRGMEAYNGHRLTDGKTKVYCFKILQKSIKIL